MYTARDSRGWRLKCGLIKLEGSSTTPERAALCEKEALGGVWDSAYYPSGGAQKVAFMMREDGVWSVYVGNPNKPLRVRRVFGPVSSSDLHPDLSPDGRWIVFSAPGTRWSPEGKQMNDLFIVSSSGGEVLPLRYEASAEYLKGSYVCPSWSQDGLAVTCAVEPEDSDSKEEGRIVISNVFFQLMTGRWTVAREEEIAAGSSPSWSSAKRCLVRTVGSD
jgi:Tol biopolymer transport system component